jgi:hypothetical protein
MNVGMAVLASLSNVCEHRFHVTLGAGHGLMHAPEWVPRLIVIEFGNRADRPPRVGGMAVLARNAKISVRTVRTCRLRLRGARFYHEHHEQCCTQIEHAPSLQHGSPLRSTPPSIRH